MSAAPPESGSRRADDDRLRRDGQRIEALLEELREMAAAPTYQRVEELVQRVVRLYGAGLERLLEIALRSGDPATESEPEPEALRRVCDDELVAGLLLIHGLHPQTPAERVRAALERLGPHLGRRVELEDIDARGVARVHIEALGSPVAGSMIERAVLDVAPELTGVEIAGVAAGSDLVQIDVARTRERG